jgi:hypothetical protein
MSPPTEGIQRLTRSDGTTEMVHNKSQSNGKRGSKHTITKRCLMLVSITYKNPSMTECIDFSGGSIGYTCETAASNTADVAGEEEEEGEDGEDVVEVGPEFGTAEAVAFAPAADETECK